SVTICASIVGVPWGFARARARALERGLSSLLAAGVAEAEAEAEVEAAGACSLSLLHAPRVDPATVAANTAKTTERLAALGARDVPWPISLIVRSPLGGTLMT